LLYLVQSVVSDYRDKETCLCAFGRDTNIKDLEAI
jgi:hypothetical protein